MTNPHQRRRWREGLLASGLLCGMMVSPAGVAGQEHQDSTIRAALVALAATSAEVIYTANIGEILAANPVTVTSSDSATVGDLGAILRGIELLGDFAVSRDWKHAVDAKAAFAGATSGELRRWALLGLGMAADADPTLRAAERAYFGEFAWSGAARAKKAWHDALDLRPQLPEPALELARIAVEDGRRSELLAAREILLSLDSTSHGAGDVQLASGEIAVRLGDFALAREHSLRAEALGGDRGKSFRLRAEAMCCLGPVAAESPESVWVAGVLASGAGALHRYYQDVVGVMTDDEMRTWAHENGEGRRRLLGRFWAKRSARGALGTADRVREHYRRLHVANQNYRRTGGRGGAPDGAIVTNADRRLKTPYDDRGVIYLLHGEPNEIISTPGQNLLPNESWIYRDGDAETFVLHFVLASNYPDYRLVDDLFAAVKGIEGSLRGSGRARVLLTIASDRVGGEELISLFSSRAAADPRYGSIAAEIDRLYTTVRADGGIAAQQLVAGMASDAGLLSKEKRAEAELMLGYDSFLPRYQTTLEAEAAVYSFRGQSGLPELTVVAIADASGLSTQVLGGSRAAVLNARLTLADSVAEEVLQVDTAVAVALPDWLPQNAVIPLIVTRRFLDSAHGTFRVTLSDAGEASRGALIKGGLPYRRYSVEGLTISDVVVASDSGGSWNREGVSLKLALGDQVAADQEFLTYFEVYGLGPDRGYEVEVEVEEGRATGLLSRIHGAFSRPDGLRLRFEGVSEPGVGNVVRKLYRIRSSLQPGRYRLYVRVTDSVSGASAEVGRRLVVTGRDGIP